MGVACIHVLIIRQWRHPPARRVISCRVSEKDFALSVLLHIAYISQPTVKMCTVSAAALRYWAVPWFQDAFRPNGVDRLLACDGVCVYDSTKVCLRRYLLLEGLFDRGRLISDNHEPEICAGRAARKKIDHGPGLVCNGPGRGIRSVQITVSRQLQYSFYKLVFF